MGNPKRTNKLSSNSGSNNLSASADFKIKNRKPTDTENFMDLSNEVDRDTLDDIPESSSVASVPRTKGDHSDSDSS